jgi:hypothetical protein
MARGPNIPHELISYLGVRCLLTMPRYANLPYVVFRKSQMTEEDLRELDMAREGMSKEFNKLTKDENDEQVRKMLALKAKRASEEAERASEEAENEVAKAEPVEPEEAPFDGLFADKKS